MNAQEAATLCRAAKSVCPQQKFDEYTPDFWHPLLEDISFEDAKRALIEVAKRQPFVSPAEIRSEVARTRKRMVAAIPAVDPPWQLGDRPAEEQRWVANYRHAIADGMAEDGAKAKANYMSGITDEPEPLAIEPGVVEARLAQHVKSMLTSKPAPVKRAPVRRVPAMWAADRGLMILSASGWRSAGKDIRTPCTEAEFDELLPECTVGPFERRTEAIPVPEATAAREAAEKEREVAPVADVLARHVAPDTEATEEVA